MDDECYIHADLAYASGVQFYHTSDKSSVSNRLKIKHKEKIPKKVFGLAAVSSYGLRPDFFILKKGSINSEVYLKECVVKRLIPFIKKSYQNAKVLFWPDLATIHYTSAVLDILKQEKVDYINKNMNPQNTPKVRGIERHWAFLKRKYKERGIVSKNATSFRRLYKFISSSVSNDLVRNIVRHAMTNIRRIYRNGPYSELKLCSSNIHIMCYLSFINKCVCLYLTVLVAFNILSLFLLDTPYLNIYFRCQIIY